MVFPRISRSMHTWGLSWTLSNAPQWQWLWAAKMQSCCHTICQMWVQKIATAFIYFRDLLMLPRFSSRSAAAWSISEDNMHWSNCKACEQWTTIYQLGYMQADVLWNVFSLHEDGDKGLVQRLNELNKLHWVNHMFFTSGVAMYVWVAIYVYVHAAQTPIYREGTKCLISKLSADLPAGNSPQIIQYCMLSNFLNG